MYSEHKMDICIECGNAGKRKGEECSLCDGTGVPKVKAKVEKVKKK